MVITFTLQPTYSGATYVAGPFNISGTTNTGVTTKLASNVSKSTLLAGLVITGITDNTIGGTIQSIGTCNNSISWLVGGTTSSCGIQLNSVNNVSGTTWEYNFVSGELCQTTILEYSTNNVTWTGFGGGCKSPRYCDIGTQVGTIYFRISQYCTSGDSTVSNTISYTLPTPTPTSTPTPTPTPSPNTWLITNQDCGGSATLNTVSVNSVSMNSFTPLTSTSSTVRTNPSGVNYGNNNNTIMVGVSKIPSGTNARILVSINNGAREYYSNNFTTEPFPTVNNVLINSGDFVKVSLQCNLY